MHRFLVSLARAFKVLFWPYTGKVLIGIAILLAYTLAINIFVTICEPYREIYLEWEILGSAINATRILANLLVLGLAGVFTGWGTQHGADIALLLLIAMFLGGSLLPFLRYLPIPTGRKPPTNRS